MVFAGTGQEVQVLVAASHLAVERKDYDTAIRMLGMYVYTICTNMPMHVLGGCLCVPALGYACIVFLLLNI